MVNIKWSIKCNAFCVQFFTGFRAIGSTDKTRGEPLQESDWHNRKSFHLRSLLRLDCSFYLSLWDAPAQPCTITQWSPLFGDARCCSWAWHANTVFEYHFQVCAGDCMNDIWDSICFCFLTGRDQWVKCHYNRSTPQPSDPEFKLYRGVTTKSQCKIILCTHWKFSWEKLKLRSGNEMPLNHVFSIKKRRYAKWNWYSNMRPLIYWAFLWTQAIMSEKNKNFEKMHAGNYG